MDPTTAQTTGNYQISGGISVSAATLINETTVQLTTSRQTGGQTYTLTLNNLRDRAATPNTIAPNTTVQFNSAVFVEGLVQFERWNTPGGIQAFIDAIADGTMGPSDVKWVANLFESGRGLGDNYRGRGYTWFKPPQNGDYVFIMTVDDNARLFLSTDDNPANKKAIAAEATWSNNREWSSTTEEQRSDTYLDTEWETGAYGPITLRADRTYYLEALWQEGGGGDGVEVTYILEGDATPANGTPSALSGARVGVYVDPATLPPVVTAPTAMAAVTLNPGQSHTMSITATGATSYQWQWNGRDIPGATSASYTISSAQVTHTGQYWCFAINSNGSARSLPENVLVTATGVFNIEAEDFDYDGGQTLDVASVMPYMGGAYEGLRGDPRRGLRQQQRDRQSGVPWWLGPRGRHRRADGQRHGRPVRRHPHGRMDDDGQLQDRLDRQRRLGQLHAHLPDPGEELLGVCRPVRGRVRRQRDQQQPGPRHRWRRDRQSNGPGPGTVPFGRHGRLESEQPHGAHRCQRRDQDRRTRRSADPPLELQQRGLGLPGVCASHAADRRCRNPGHQPQRARPGRHSVQRRPAGRSGGYRPLHRRDRGDQPL
ncbi:MAG: immunoglobulin domain-containing protein [Verrucomicrobia bacterium]|nr:immunoglobulin domain-containing protein [Verrucomicrobiota bacterium]